MFKKTKIAAATVALLGAVAAQNVSAVALDESGKSAQVLLFPYYNVNNGFISMYNIRNTHNETKAVKIRFRESRVSNDVLDFNVYMSPYDHYSFFLQYDPAAKVVRIVTGDNTCSYPSKDLVNQQTFLQAYKNTELSDLNEGYIEVIEMGNLLDGIDAGKAGDADGRPAFDADPSTSSVDDIVKAVKHGTNKIPANCGLVTTAWSNGGFTQGGAINRGTADLYPANNGGDWYLDSPANNLDFYGGHRNPAGLYAPTGGLSGYQALLDSASGLIYAQPATTIRNWQTAVAQHYRPDDTSLYLLPSLASGNVVTTVKSNASGTGSTYHVWDGVRKDFSEYDPNLAYKDGTNPKRGSGVNPFPVSDVLAATGLHNDYLMSVTPAWYGQTDWVVTLPMRKHGIFNNYRFDNLVDDAGNTTRSNNKTDPTVSVSYFKYVGKDTEFSYVAYDREEQKPTPNVGFSPAVQQTSTSYLVREANVIQWNFVGNPNPSLGVLGTPAQNAIPLALGGGYTEGWAELIYKPGSYRGTSLTDLALGNYSPLQNWVVVRSLTGVAPNQVPGTGADANGTNALISQGVFGVPSIGFSAFKGVFPGGKGLGETVEHVFYR